MKKYMKKKSIKAGPNAAGPKYRTPDHFKGEKFSSFKKPSTKHIRSSFDSIRFKVQHKG